MTKKDYTIIAECIKREIKAHWLLSGDKASICQGALLQFADFFSSQAVLENNKFDKEKFFKAIYRKD